jgi:hypothetical protein
MKEIHNRTVSDFIDRNNLLGLLRFYKVRRREFMPYVREFKALWKKDYEKRHGVLLSYSLLEQVPKNKKIAKPKAVAEALYKYLKISESREMSTSKITKLPECYFWKPLKPVERGEKFTPPEKEFEKSIRFTFLKGLLRYKKGQTTPYTAFILCLARYFSVPAMAFHTLGMKRDTICPIFGLDDHDWLTDPYNNVKNPKYFGEIISDRQLYAVSWFRRGLLYKAIGDSKKPGMTKRRKYGKALRCARIAIELEFTFSEAWVLKAYCLAKLGKYKAAMDALDNAGDFMEDNKYLKKRYEHCFDKVLREIDKSLK